jgi:hypothetical protein
VVGYTLQPLYSRGKEIPVSTRQEACGFTASLDAMKKKGKYLSLLRIKIRCPVV